MSYGRMGPGWCSVEKKAPLIGLLPNVLSMLTERVFI